MVAFTEDDGQSEFGDIFDDAAGFVSDGADALGDFVKAIPGGQWVLDGAGSVTGAVGDFAKGPMREFAKSGIGETIFRAVSVAISATLYVVPYVGLTLGFLAWSIPGLAKGDRFDKALVEEFIYRCQKVAEVFVGKLGEEAGKAATEAMGGEMKDAVEKLSQLATDAGVPIEEVGSKLGITPKSLADMLGIREDVCAYALAWAQRKSEEYLKSLGNSYDPETGKFVGLSLGKQRTVGKTLGKKSANVPTICEQYENAKRLKLPPATIEALRKKCEASKSVSAAIRPPLSAVTKAPIATTAKTVAAQTAISQAVSTPVGSANTIVETAQKTADARSTKLGLIAGVAGAALGAGGSILAGLSYVVAAPIGIGFGIGAGVGTKLLTRKK